MQVNVSTLKSVKDCCEICVLGRCFIVTLSQHSSQAIQHIFKIEGKKKKHQDKKRGSWEWENKPPQNTRLTEVQTLRRTVGKHALRECKTLALLTPLTSPHFPFGLLPACSFVPLLHSSDRTQWLLVLCPLLLDQKPQPANSEIISLISAFATGVIGGGPNTKLCSTKLQLLLKGSYFFTDTVRNRSCHISAASCGTY